MRRIAEGDEPMMTASVTESLVEDFPAQRPRPYSEDDHPDGRLRIAGRVVGLLYPHPGRR